MKFFSHKDRHIPLANSEASLALFEERAQCREIILSGSQANRVDVVSAQCPPKGRALFLHQIGKTFSGRALAGIDFDLFAGFCVFQSDNTDVR